jgi:hypothetical protein
MMKFYIFACNMKKPAFVLFILFLLTGTVFSQVNRLDSSVTGAQIPQPGKFSYGLELGSEFASFSGAGSGFSSWITPRVSFNVNKRLTVGGGFSVINTNYFNVRPLYSIESATPWSGNTTSAAIFVNGQYKVNDRLSVFGSAYKVFPVSSEPLPYNPFNPISAKGSQGVDFNVGYKIGRNAYIQAGFRYSDGRSPYQTDPFNRDPFNQSFPFQQSGMGNQRW